jgi:hypothetical protein
MNECNGLFTDFPITDHAGPGVGCQMVNQFNTCPCDPKPRIVDLSTAAFVALGGNIVSGHFPVTISW